MAYKEALQTQAVQLTLHKDKPLEAYYLGKKVFENESGKYIVQEFTKKDGTALEVWGFDMLNRKLVNIPKGCLTKIIYTGTKVDGDKKHHECTVFFDNEKLLTNLFKKDDDDLPF